MKLKMILTVTMALILGGLLIFPQTGHAAFTSKPWQTLTVDQYMSMFKEGSYTTRETLQVGLGDNPADYPLRLYNANDRLAFYYNDPNWDMYLVTGIYKGQPTSQPPDRIGQLAKGEVIRVEKGAVLTTGLDSGKLTNYIKATSGKMYQLSYTNTSWDDIGNQKNGFYYEPEVLLTIKPLKNPLEKDYPAMSFEYYMPADGKLTVSQEQLNSSSNDSLLVLKVSGYKQISVAVDGAGSVIDWDKETVFSKVISRPDLEGYIDLTEALKSVKSRLGVGKHTLYMSLYGVEDYDAPEERDPTKLVKMDFDVVQKTGDVPPQNNNGVPPSDPSVPQIPKPPDNNWDVVGWLKYILDWILYVINVVGYLLQRLGNIIASLFGQANGLTSTLTAIFSFLPPEVTSLIVMGVIISILLRVFGK